MSEYNVLPDDLKAFSALMDAAGGGGYYPSEHIGRIHPIDPETSMPQLPEGYFWRVYKQFNRPYVGLYKREETTVEKVTFMTLFTGKTVPKTTTLIRKIEDYHVSQSASDPVAAIFEAGTYLLAWLPDHLVKEVNPINFAKYYGEYPPKNLIKAEDE